MKNPLLRQWQITLNVDVTIAMSYLKQSIQYLWIKSSNMAEAHIA